MIMTIAGSPYAPAQKNERPPNRLAQQITGRPYVSHSQLSMMRSCPRRFAFSYVENAPIDFQPSSLLCGGAIHAALEFHFRCRLEGLTATPAALLSAFHDSWRREREAAGKNIPVRYNKGEDASSIQAMAERVINAFLASPASRPHGQILGIEESLRVVLDPDLPDILAKVDLVTQGADALHLVDWKTSRSRWNEQKAAESADQLLLYGRTAGSMSRHLGIPVRLHFVVITKAKTPVIQVLEVPAREERLNAVKENVAQVWEAIQVGNFYPSPSPMTCTTCPYRSRCPALGGN